MPFPRTVHQGSRSPVTDQVGGRSVNTPLSTLGFSPCLSPTAGNATALCPKTQTQSGGCSEETFPIACPSPYSSQRAPRCSKASFTFLWSHSETSLLSSITNQTLIRKFAFLSNISGMLLLHINAGCVCKGAATDVANSECCWEWANPPEPDSVETDAK